MALELLGNIRVADGETKTPCQPLVGINNEIGRGKGVALQADTLDFAVDVGVAKGLTPNDTGVLLSGALATADYCCADPVLQDHVGLKWESTSVRHSGEVRCSIDLRRRACKSWRIDHYP
jgi:hypothetical protein